MKRIMVDGYSTYFDVLTNTQFLPVLQPDGLFVGVAEIDDGRVELFRERRGFRIVQDAVEAVPAKNEPAIAGDGANFRGHGPHPNPPRFSGRGPDAADGGPMPPE